MIYKQIMVIDHVATGAHWRKIRMNAGLSLRQLAAHVGYSAPYLSDLELGRRSWTTAAEARYINFFENRTKREVSK